MHKLICQCAGESAVKEEFFVVVVVASYVGWFSQGWFKWWFNVFVVVVFAMFL